MKNYNKEMKEFYRKNTIKYQEPPLSEKQIEVMLIFIGTFLATYILLVGLL